MQVCVSRQTVRTASEIKDVLAISELRLLAVHFHHKHLSLLQSFFAGRV